MVVPYNHPFLWIPLSTRFDRQLAMMNPGWQLYNMCYPNPFSDMLHDFLAHPTRSLPRSMFAKEPLPTAQPSESRRNWHHTVTWMGPFMERDEAIPSGWFGAKQWHVCWFLNTIHSNTLPELLFYHARDIHTINRGYWSHVRQGNALRHLGDVDIMFASARSLRGVDHLWSKIWQSVTETPRGRRHKDCRGTCRGHPQGRCFHVWHRNQLEVRALYI